MGRRYFGRKRGGRGGKTTVPIMGLITAGALGGGIVAQPSGLYGGDAPINHLVAGDVGRGSRGLMANLTNPKTYTAVAVPIAVWIIGRAFLGKRKLSKRVSLF